MAHTHIRFNNDDSEYEPSDSEDDYTEKDKLLLHKVRKGSPTDSDSQDEVYGIVSDENNSDIALSDVEEQDDHVPDIRAWGKDKKNFYSTDYVDPDYGGFQGKDASLAEIEEQEAKNLQKQLMQQLDDGDFSLEMFVKKKETDIKDDLEEVIKTDVSKLSKRQKLQLLKEESPEFFELVDDFKVRITLAKEVLKPILTLSEASKIKPCEALDFVKFYYELILNYCTNISMYLLYKVSKINLKNHPIAKRLFQYRQYISQMEAVFNEIIKPQLDVLGNVEENPSSTLSSKKTLKLLANINKKNIKNEAFEKESINKQDKQSIPPKLEEENTLNKEKLSKTVYEESSESEEVERMKEDGNEQIKMTGEKRAITYQIAKNKGLTPHRKKEQRNPRVKHRNKFRKAKIRRKGAVREVRKELSRYAGEISGIKASVTKSIKIKG